MKKINYKIIIIIISLIAFQSFSYFVAKFTPFEANLLTSNLDSSIPFVSVFVYFYIFWYLMLAGIPLLLYFKDEEKLYKYITATFISLIVATFVFVLYPTIVIRPEVTSGGFSNFIINLIYMMDDPAVNCLPSVHCIICFMYIYTLFRNKNVNFIVRIVLMILSILVIMSTLFTKQHVVIDVVGALIVSSIVYLLVGKFKIHKTLMKTLKL